jgi:hypothetical protein
METGVSNTTHSLFDKEALQRASSSSYNLSIQLGLDGFSFCILDGQEVLALESYHHPLSQLEDIIRNHEWLQKDFAQTLVTVVTEKYTLVPTALLQEASKKEHLAFNHQRSEKLEAVSDKLQQLDAHIVYGISVPVKSIIHTYFPKAVIKHYGSCWLDQQLSQHKHQEDALLLMSIQSTHMEITLLKSGRLHYFNTFRYKTAEDLTYYLLFVCEQLDLDPNSIPLQLYGELEKQSQIYDYLYKYVRHISFGKRNEHIRLSPAINQLPPHYYHHLLHQHLCV